MTIKAIAILLAIVGATLWGVHTIYQAGAKSRDGEVAKLVAQRDGYKAQVEDYTARVERQKDAFNVATDGLKRELNTVKEDLGKRLIEAEYRANHTKTKEVIRYVNAKADAACTVPAGFVRLHNESANPDTPFEAAPVPGSGSANDEAPSGVALSGVATVIRDNYAECTERGEVIKVWQDWYSKSKAAYDKAKAIIEGAAQ